MITVYTHKILFIKPNILFMYHEQCKKHWLKKKQQQQQQPRRDQPEMPIQTLPGLIGLQQEL